MLIPKGNKIHETTANLGPHIRQIQHQPRTDLCSLKPLSQHHLLTIQGTLLQAENGCCAMGLVFSQIVTNLYMDEVQNGCFKNL